MAKRKLTDKVIERIRNEVLSGKSKYHVAVELQLNPSTVYRHTQGIPNKRQCNASIRGATLELLRQLHKQGYVISQGNSQYLRTLKRHFPELQLIRIRSQHVCFIKGHEQEALQGFLEKEKYKVLSYHKLAPVCRAFGIDLPVHKKEDVVQRFGTRLRKRRNDSAQNKVRCLCSGEMSVYGSESEKPHKIHITDYKSLQSIK